uniref:DNA polymerase delta subunit 4 n=1 Tax=Geotrypetes seraphini TaxID=260995 RepID=A0A6P8P6R6_GEOSA|nr:DNA polymerase delta subunit 4 [Geotrypetes seraphini]XP_033776562.1 DNA polymerase delta subunit 4 [Geotrypetes seraphini]XP_033776565.1 DNA polymerase delta subunit 4 [Geotrypetes seraphini]
MGRKGLITDSYQVVKHKKKDEQKKKEVKSSQTGYVEVKKDICQVVTKEEVELEVLKQFDLNWRFGPCTGITRLQRWERAVELDLEPPIFIRELILRHKDDPQFLNSVWHEYPI